MDKYLVAVPATGKVIYTCPMHPEVQQDHPGNCPKCGMTPVLKTPTVGPDQAEFDELHDMTRSFWGGAGMTLPMFASRLGSDTLLGQIVNMRQFRRPNHDSRD